MLKFLGRGSAFTDENNSAFFLNNKDLIIIDCSVTAFIKIKKMNFDEINDVYVLVTHTHGDHTSGIGTLLQYLYFVHKKKLIVVAPSELVYDDLKLLLNRIEGCEMAWFNLIVADNLSCEWFIKAIPTCHVDTLEEKCFGYKLNVAGHNVVYTGDTNTIEPFINEIAPGDYLYCEISSGKSAVHLSAEDVLPVLIDLTNKDVSVFLMHIDNEKTIKSLVSETSIKIAPVFDL